MRVNVNSNGMFSITSIEPEMLKVVMFILEHIQDRCFEEYDEALDQYLSGGDIAIALTGEERNNFNNFIDHFWIEYENLKCRMNLKRGKGARS